jgi:hypothetical protein
MHRASKTLTAVALALISHSASVTAQETFKERVEAGQRQAIVTRAARTTTAIASISKYITPGHLAACKKQAEQPGGTSALITIKVNGTFGLSKPYTCIYTGVGLFDKTIPAMAVYIAPMSYVTALGKPVSAHVMCKFTLDGGKVMTETGIAPTRGPQGLGQVCQF